MTTLTLNHNFGASLKLTIACYLKSITSLSYTLCEKDTADSTDSISQHCSHLAKLKRLHSTKVDCTVESQMMQAADCSQMTGSFDFREWLLSWEMLY